jgi:hypothetical protein
LATSSTVTLAVATVPPHTITSNNKMELRTRKLHTP